jgi:hypothetical protein
LLGHVDIDREELRTQATKYGVDDLYTYLDTCCAQRTSRLFEWEDNQRGQSSILTVETGEHSLMTRDIGILTSYVRD